jgi:hypothetical protein
VVAVAEAEAVSAAAAVVSIAAAVAASMAAVAVVSTAVRSMSPLARVAGGMPTALASAGGDVNRSLSSQMAYIKGARRYSARPFYFAESLLLYRHGRHNAGHDEN